MNHMRTLMIGLIVFLLPVACHRPDMSLCEEWQYLKYPVVKKGYIGIDSSPQGDICYQRKWRSYVGLSKDCIKTLLGEPYRESNSIFMYYFSSNPRNDGAVGVLRLYFRGGRMKRITCGLV
jgi:hypothetical protein